MQTITSNPLLVGFIILCVVTIILLALVFWMYFKMRKFLIGIDSANIQDSLNFVSTNLSDLQTFRQEIETYLELVERRLKKSVQSVHTVRFNPYKGTGDGGNQSFATALLSENGDGVVISGLHSRDQIRVFSKPIQSRKSTIELSDEEKEALENAIGQLGME